MVSAIHRIDLQLNEKMCAKTHTCLPKSMREQARDWQTNQIKKKNKTRIKSTHYLAKQTPLNYSLPHSVCLVFIFATKSQIICKQIERVRARTFFLFLTIRTIIVTKNKTLAHRKTIQYSVNRKTVAMIHTITFSHSNETTHTRVHIKTPPTNKRMKLMSTRHKRVDAERSSGNAFLASNVESKSHARPVASVCVHSKTRFGRSLRLYDAAIDDNSERFECNANTTKCTRRDKIINEFSSIDRKYFRCFVFDFDQ